MQLTPTQIQRRKLASSISTTVRRAKSRRKFERVLQMSREGISLEETAENMGTNKSNIRSLCKTFTGTGAWPIKD